MFSFLILENKNFQLQSSDLDNRSKKKKKKHEPIITCAKSATWPSTVYEKSKKVLIGVKPQGLKNTRVRCPGTRRGVTAET